MRKLKQVILNLLAENGKHLVLIEVKRDIPHIHVFTAKHKKSAPRLDIADYFIHEDKRYKMNSKEKAAFDIFMSTKCKHNPELTNWQFCIIRWNETHPRKLSFELKNKSNYLNLPL